MCIGGHYTMDRHDAVTAAELVGAKHGDPVPLRHVPADRDRRRRRSSPTSSRGPRRRSSILAPGRDPLVTHASSSSRPSATALPTLGGALADHEGVAEAYSVTGEWDFVAIVLVRARAARRAW